MAAHRYWRLLFRATGGGANVAIGEVQMRTIIGGNNVATGGLALSSSNFDGNYVASKAFDGKTTDTGLGNGWASLNMTGSEGLGSWPWLMYDFGAGKAVDIVEIVLYAPGTGGIANVNQFPTAWRFQWSDDGVSWTTQRDYAFDATTPAWTYLSSRIYDVQPLGAVSIHNGQIMAVNGYRSPSLGGQPGRPVYDPTSEAMKVRLGATYQFMPGHGGLYKLSGTTTALGFPAVRRVRLYEQHSGRAIAEVTTPPSGLFEFRNIHKGPWMVIGLDDSGTQNGVIFSHILAVPM